MSAPILSSPSSNLLQNIQGVWWLLSRIDWTKDGQRRIDPILGESPIAILAYAKNHFSAQFMKQDRTESITSQATFKGQNNTQAFEGYDAYFGTYEVNEESGKVSHTLIGSIMPSNVGVTVSRDLRVNCDELIIQLETTSQEGDVIIRTLTWKRIN
jgi:hypothetical protein